VRAELIAERKARQLAAAVANAEGNRRSRQLERERLEAVKRQRDSEYHGTRVSAPGGAPERAGLRRTNEL
jgi:hypothetical protein